MSGASELRLLVKQLQSSSTEQEIVGILQTLKDYPHITEPVLRESKAGLAVGKLRSHASKQVADQAKDLVKKWKQTVEQAKLQNGKGSVSSGASKPQARKQSLSVAPSTPTTPSASTPAMSHPKPSDVRNSKSDGVSGITGDTTRNKCLELIYDALAFDSGAPSDQIFGRAKGIEAAVYAEFNGTTAAYKSKIRSLFVNLKDKNNPGLRESIVAGDLPVQRFCKMTSQEMASEERKAADNKIKSDNLFKTLGAGEVQAETDAFQCGRCKQRKCRYRQAQTRSADEPMTTFVTCTVCNNRWKFS
ncbi:transcription factor S-II, central domain-containing protein [Cytidiella melzeri]|nr:transcription factor S-II, central domain-containing protein [Cytidiella melzeri]